MSKWSTKTTVQGKTVNWGMRWFLEATSQVLRESPHYGEENEDPTLYQGGYSNAVGASAGTHAGGGTADATPFNWRNRSWVYRVFGAASFHRSAIRGVWVEHIHFGLNGDGTAALAEQQQWAAYLHGLNALANGGKDSERRPHNLPIYFVDPSTERGKPGTYYLTSDQTLRDEPSSDGKSFGDVKKDAKFTVVGIVKNGSGNLWAGNIHGEFVPKSHLSLTEPGTTTTPTPEKQGVVRVGSLNFPDKTKITTATEAARIKRAVEQVKNADLDIVGVQEGVGRKSDGSPSDLMAALVKALGSDWDLIVPTLNYDENYFLRRKGTTNYTQHEDVVIRGSVGGVSLGGRHVALTTFGTAIGDLTVGNTQLVNDNRPGAEVQAALAGAALRKIGGKRVLLGDFNTSGPLAGLPPTGLHDSRLLAKAITNRDAATYTNQDKTRPSTNPFWKIDGIWVSDGIEVNGFNVILDVDAEGYFVKPRVSDHSLTIVSLS